VLLAQHELLVRRCVQADEPRADERVPRDGPIPERPARRVPIDERVRTGFLYRMSNHIPDLTKNCVRTADQST
jgi:hypothetical protein